MFQTIDKPSEKHLWTLCSEPPLGRLPTYMATYLCEAAQWESTQFLKRTPSLENKAGSNDGPFIRPRKLHFVQHPRYSMQTNS